MLWQPTDTAHGGKFWGTYIRSVGDVYHLVAMWGRLGDAATEKTRGTYRSEGGARVAMDLLINEKKRKGYRKP